MTTAKKVLLYVCLIGVPSFVAWFFGSFSAYKNSTQDRSEQVARTVYYLVKKGQTPDLIDAGLCFEECLMHFNQAEAKFGRVLSYQVDEAKTEFTGALTNVVLSVKRTKGETKETLISFSAGRFNSLLVESSPAIR